MAFREKPSPSGPVFRAFHEAFRCFSPEPRKEAVRWDARARIGRREEHESREKKMCPR